ncbi:S1/P1 nuclease [Polaribacter batillariae]|uniref:S1/P1 nuclease n=1 Tax=Polaribacter batillariae TaxID=2808900 RepID=A0ABX7SVA7_9FLAO|nr:S1/P1 nuclease [Polaribacter batillariae]QTD38111.1 S1/P1 nuclease [Polaribacter batillariae]
MKLKIAVLLSFLFFSKPATEETFFWGQNGHRATGKIAEKYLKRRAKKKIDKLLKGESLAFVSTFADEIKSDRKYSEFFPWHYVNMDLNQTYAEAEKNPKGDLVTGIKKCIAVLKDKKSSDKDRAFYLKLLIHFVGDLHQPMHIGQKEDKGGNTIQVQWFGKGTNLHAVWDTKMIEEWNMSYLELADNAKDLSKKQIKAIEKGTIEDWVNEVHVLTREIYKSVKVGENLRYRYSYDHFKTVRNQLQVGGIRLAKILNDIFC